MFTAKNGPVVLPAAGPKTTGESDDDDDDSLGSVEDDEISEFDMKDIADMMNEEGLGAFGDDADLVANCDRGANTKKRDARLKSLLARMIKLLIECNQEWTKPLLLKVNCRYLQAKGDFISKDYKLFDLLAGVKTVEKRAVMNRIILLCGVKWKKLSGRKGTKGKHYQPVSLCKNIRDLLCKLRERGIDYNIKEFKDKGEFCGVMADQWHIIKQTIDPKLGTGIETRRVPADYILLLVAAIESKKIDPFNNHRDLWGVVAFCIGFYCCFRGGKDQCLLLQEEIKFSIFNSTHGPLLCGEENVHVSISESKATRLSVHNPTIKPNQRKDFFVPQESGLAPRGWRPVEWFKFMKARSHPDAKKWYCAYIRSSNTRKKVSQAMKQRDIEYNAQNPRTPRTIKEYDIWFQPGVFGHTNYNLGADSISKILKELGEKIGIPDFDKATGQSIRALSLSECARGNLNQNDAANLARQSNVSVQQVYVDAATEGRIGNQLQAICVNSVLERNDIRMNPGRAPTEPVLPAKRPAEEVVVEQVAEQPTVNREVVAPNNVAENQVLKLQIENLQLKLALAEEKLKNQTAPPQAPAAQAPYVPQYQAPPPPQYQAPPPPQYHHAPAPYWPQPPAPYGHQYQQMPLPPPVPYGYQSGYHGRMEPPRTVNRRVRAPNPRYSNGSSSRGSSGGEADTEWSPQNSGRYNGSHHGRGW